jgi:putative hemolysin
VRPLTRGIYTARLASSPEEIAAAQALRSLSFRAGRGLQATSDADRFDDLCRHIVVTDDRTKGLVSCFRVMLFPNGHSIDASYSAQFYDLTALKLTQHPLMELGRFCLHPDHNDPDILRVAWAALTALVDQHAVSILFGCSSFDGADPALHGAALAHLARHHLAPLALCPGVVTAESLDIRPLAAQAPSATPSLPSLLRTYLGMGGWVSDHAVIDRDLNTLHVFTALDISAVPQARARALRALTHIMPHATS